MLLIWPGILWFGFHHTVSFLRRDSLLILPMLLMMKVVISVGVHRDWPNLVSGEESCWVVSAEWVILQLWLTSLSPVTSSYGDMPAHNLLWRECEKSSQNVAARLAAIPLVQVIFLLGQIKQYDINYVLRLEDNSMFTIFLFLPSCPAIFCTLGHKTFIKNLMVWF